MSYRVRLLILICCALFSAGGLSARPARTYQSSAIAPILENDIAFAKHNAFQRAQQGIMDAAIRDILDPGIYENHHQQIFRTHALRPKYHLVSVKILNESGDNGEFSIEIEAKVQISTLEDELRKLGMVFKKDPWFPVTLLIETGIEFDVDMLREKLAPFHIAISRTETIDYTGIPLEERYSKTFTEDLFLNYANKGIIYILETTVRETESESLPGDDATGDMNGLDEEPKELQIIGVQLRIIRQSDLEELNSIALKLQQPLTVDSEQFQEDIAALMPRLFSLLTINSVKRNTYESGLAASYNIAVSGLNAPHLRSAFEHQILQERRSINDFSLVELSADSCRYVLHSSKPMDLLAEDLIQPNPYFELTIEEKAFNTISISAFYQYTADGTDPEFWPTDENTVQQIREVIVDPSLEEGEEANNAELNSYYIPSFIEIEPNNSMLRFNRIPSSTYILGEVASRADEDIFELKGVEITDEQLETAIFSGTSGTNESNSLFENQQDIDSNEMTGSEVENAESTNEAGDVIPAELPMNVGKNATVYIDWIQIGKTSLAPQLKLYDESFNFINAFNLVRSQKRLRFHYTFPEAPPERIYIRVSDRIGFIQGETGGFKRYTYLIRYSWNGEDEEEPESPLVPLDNQLIGSLSPNE